MIVFGWIVATLGACGIVGSVILEVKKQEPIYLLMAKISMGIFAVGGIILGITAL